MQLTPEAREAILCSGGALAWLIVALLGSLLPRAKSLPLATLLGVGGAAILAAGSMGADVSLSFPSPLFLGSAPLAFKSDALARWFLAIIGLIALPVSAFTHGYLGNRAGKLRLGFVWAALAVLFLSMAGVVLSANALAFLLFWELMAFSSFALVATDHGHRSIREAALVYLGATRTGTGFLMGGFLWAYTQTGTWAFDQWHLSGPIAIGPAALVLVGLAVKAGAWPFHLWLPIAHPAAPAPASAVMSGVMIKTAIYAMVRLFVLGRHVEAPFLGEAVLVLGAVSAFWGVIFALLQHDLKRLLAYHSVENIGIILMGLGVAIVSADWNMPGVAGLALAAALFHTLNHAVFKTLLFLCAGCVDSQTQVRNLEELGGLVHRMRWTAASFMVGSAAICALPPFNGFASEWLLFNSFFGMATTQAAPAVRLTGLLLMAWLGLVGALAVACFVKAIGVTFLGVPRTAHAKNAREGARSMIVPQAGLALACLALGLLAPFVLRVLASLAGDPHLLAAWTLPSTSLAFGLGALTLIIGGMCAIHGQKHRSRTYITWECGFGNLSPRTQYTGTSFAQPISRLFGAVYRYAIGVTLRHQQPGRFPDEIAVKTEYEPYLETRLYMPALRAVRRLSGTFIMRLQAGGIHQYLLYMIAAMALVLWLGVGR